MFKVNGVLSIKAIRVDETVSLRIKLVNADTHLPIVDIGRKELEEGKTIYLNGFEVLMPVDFSSDDGDDEKPSSDD